MGLGKSDGRGKGMNGRGRENMERKERDERAREGCERDRGMEEEGMSG